MVSSSFFEMSTCSLAHQPGTKIVYFRNSHFLPELERIVLLRKHGKAVPQEERAYRRSLQVLWVNLVLGGMVLALTALVRAS